MIPDRARADLVTVSDCRYGRMMHLKQDKYIGRAIVEYGEYSESEVQLFRQVIQPDSIVVDAGANIGAHTVALASLVPRGGVVAFEPFRYLYNILCGNLALNGITNAVPYYAALGERPGVITVPALDYTLEENYGGMALGACTTGNKVPVLRLDDLLPQVHFIKADVEGMERDVLEGAQRLIRECQPILYVENNPPDTQPLIDYIHSLNYDLWWHYAPHFNPGNYKQNPEDIYQGIVSWNMIGLPHGPDHQLSGFEKIERKLIVSL
jgi:FkbM family methyltransferase